MLAYLRILSVIGVLLFLSVAGGAWYYLQQMNMNSMTEAAEQTGTGIVHNYATSIWKKYRDVLAGLSTGQQAGNNPQVAQFAVETAGFFRNMPIVRANIYNPSGQMLMSNAANTKIKLAGGVLSPAPDFVKMQMAQPSFSSQLNENVPLEGGGKTSLVQTVIPVRSEKGLDGAVEIISQLPQSTEAMDNIRLYIFIGIAGVLILFPLMLFFTSSKAEAIIAKQHEVNIELAAAAEAAQAQNREKSQFLANISHELRTPLNAIIGFSDIIKQEVMANVEERKYHDYINDIHSSGVHLLSLINDILDYSKAEAGKLEMEISEVNATKMIQNSMRLVTPRAEAGKVELIEAMPKEPIIIFTDSKKFKQVLLNLLSNAVKFTPTDGKVRISAWRNMAEDNYTFEVRDTGIGIAPKDISVAMSPFGQIDSKLSRKYEGTGLGLPLTKKFVELMGGKFTIESEVGVGTVITFSLPRELKAADSPPEAKHASA